MKITFTSMVLLFSSFSFGQGFDVYVSDAGNFDQPPWQILKYDSDGMNPVVFIKDNLNWPQDILFLEKRNEVLISNLGSGSVNIHDASTGVYKGIFASSIGGPTRFKIGPDSLLYILQWTGNGKVKRYKMNGDFVDDFTSEGVTQSIGLDWDSDGNLYVSSYNSAQVRKFDQDGNDMGAFINSNLLGPTNIWFDKNGDLLVSDYRGTSVKRFDSEGKLLGDFLTGLKNSEGVAYTPNGDILIGNGAGHNVRMYNAQGSYLMDLVLNGSGNLRTPNAVVVRLKEKTSVKDDEIEEVIGFSPNIGKSFSVSQNFIEKIDSIVIYNLSGTVLDIIQVNQALSWDANQVIDGMYIAKFFFKNGQERSQRIIVSK